VFDQVRRATVLNLCHLYRFQEKHADHIVHLTLSMFDQLPKDRHLCGAQEREILWAASMVHDIGVSVDYHDHHKHGSYLILNAGLPGYTHRELALIALLVRYHRKGRPTVDELGSLLEEDDDQRLVQMCALLRLAEQLDRPRDGSVRDVRLTVQGDNALLEVLVSGDEQVALWAVEHHREIFEQAFGLNLEVVPVPDEE
jgi:exopolyphosphatase/guanosine-5'-triphosphate,3'-diphosphate pyrophosphatase